MIFRYLSRNIIAKQMENRFFFLIWKNNAYAQFFFTRNFLDKRNLYIDKITKSIRELFNAIILII